MRIGLAVLAAMAAIGFGATASAADYKTLRHLSAGPPTPVTALPADANARPVQFARIVVHPTDGEPWGMTYFSSVIANEDEGSATYKFMIWQGGASDGGTASFARVFDEELRRTSFRAESGEALFEENNGSADLKVGVLVDDMKGRFCLDCPNPFNPKGIPATVVMTAHWEIYSTLERKVIARVTTSGGADYKTRLQGNFLPAVFEAFRENVRQLLASEQFRRVVASRADGQIGAPLVAGPVPGSIALVGPKTRVPVAQATKSVAVIYAADGQGSGFLVSSEGYVLTNRHVVGGSKYVKLKWSNGAETVGEVLRSDGRRDVALIKTDAQGRAPLALRLGPVQQGETVFAIGTPLDDSLQNTMTKGIVSAERVESGLRLIQSDAGVNHGNSGCPLLDEKGSVIAITVSGILPASMQLGLNFFIPIDDALKALALTPGAS
ncbi:MAG: hypothetical protein JWP73_1731 [Phenylobacterium sp.]|nr:hypothetical protein [Phenylobacterium sp.]